MEKSDSPYIEEANLVQPDNIDLAGRMDGFMQEYSKITSETGKDLKVQVQY